MQFGIAVNFMQLQFMVWKPMELDMFAWLLYPFTIGASTCDGFSF